MDTEPLPAKSRAELPVEVTLIFRHFHPILAGAAERFRRYSVPLAELGIGYDVFTLREDEAHPPEEQMHERLRVHRIAAQGIPWKRDAALFQAAFHALRARAPDGRVLQTSLAHDLATPWLRRTRSHGVRCIYVGTMVGKAETDLPIWRRWIRDWKNRRNFGCFDKVIASTTVMARWFQQCGVAPERIQVIANGVDVERFRPVESAIERVALRADLGIEGTGPVVVFAGSIVPRKGVDLLIRAWPRVLKIVPEARLVLVGGFDRPTFMTRERMGELASFQKNVRDSAERPECGGSITFVGESSRVQDWLRAADVFVFPTEQEGMGNVVLEAMACGIPCVITEFHGLPKEEFGTPGREFVLVPRTEEDLARGLSEALRHPAESAAIGQRGCEWARHKLDVRMTIRKYAELYRELANQN